MSTETNDVDPYGYEDQQPSRPRVPGWLKVGAVAAASALFGGLAASWYYRKAIRRLQDAELEPPDSNFGISEGESGDMP